MNAVSSLLEVRDVVKAFPKGDGASLLVLDHVNLSVREGEIVGLLGRSGSGKSSLLRLIAGLSKPTSGEVSYLGRPVDGPAEGVSMVFQSFALFPWLTVLENVALGLEALRLSREEIRSRSLAAIDLIGLDGFESAYPRELSGGMRQRVGFARALVVHPNILLMDEAFSALDVLTAETLRTDFLELWGAGHMPIKGVIIVTHNIEEAVQMCDRILVFSTNPGRVVTEIPVKLPQPRDRLDPSFRELVEQIYVEMTAKRMQTANEKTARGQVERPAVANLDVILSNHVSTNLISGLIEAVAAAPYHGRADLPVIASDLMMEIDDLFPVVEALQLLRFAELEGGDLALTVDGMAFANAELDDRKRIFSKHLLGFVPLAAHVRRVLDERASHVAPRSRFLDELEDHMTPEAAEQTLRTIVSWGRYGEVFAYDDQHMSFSLENPT